MCFASNQLEGVGNMHYLIYAGFLLNLHKIYQP